MLDVLPSSRPSIILQRHPFDVTCYPAVDGIFPKYTWEKRRLHFAGKWRMKTLLAEIMEMGDRFP